MNNMEMNILDHMLASIPQNPLKGLKKQTCLLGIYTQFAYSGTEEFVLLIQLYMVLIPLFWWTISFWTIKITISN